jgi:hypothetical protein
VKRCLVVVCLTAFLSLAGVAQAAIYWGNYGSNGSGGTIGRAATNGSSPTQAFIAGAQGPVGVAANGTYVYLSATGRAERVLSVKRSGSTKVSLVVSRR